jgi:hypothetical protein
MTNWNWAHCSQPPAAAHFSFACAHRKRDGHISEKKKNQNAPHEATSKGTSSRFFFSVSTPVVARAHTHTHTHTHPPVFLGIVATVENFFEPQKPATTATDGKKKKVVARCNFEKKNKVLWGVSGGGDRWRRGAA